MDVHTGTWSLNPSDTVDMIFASSAPATVVLTITRVYDPSAISVQVNGAVPPNGTLNAGEPARTFRFASVSTIQIAASGPLQFVINGGYQITVL